MTIMKENVCNYILKWVENNICSGKGINSLVLSTGYSRKTIEKWFYDKYEMSIFIYLMRRRLTFAATLLKLTSVTITEIAYSLHYSSHQNFCRAFKKYTSKTPSLYRNENYWDFSKLQESLLHSYKKEIHHTTRYLQEKYMHGRKLVLKDILHQDGGGEIYNNIKWIVIDWWRKRKSDIIVCFDMTNKISMGRTNTEQFCKTDANITLTIGDVSDNYNDGAILIPGGNYFIYKFHGTWEEYVIYARTIYVKTMSKMNLKLKRSPIYIRFLYKHSNIDDHVECTIYSPIQS